MQGVVIFISFLVLIVSLASPLYDILNCQSIDDAYRAGAAMVARVSGTIHFLFTSAPRKTKFHNSKDVWDCSLEVGQNLFILLNLFSDLLMY